MTSTINNKAQLFIGDQEHFTNNQALISISNPVVDAIIQLKHAQTSLSDTWKELLTVMCAITKIDVGTQYEIFQKYSESVLHLYSQEFQDNI